MTTRGRRGAGEVHDITVDILKEIRDQLRTVNERLEAGFKSMNTRLDTVTARLDNLRDLAGDRYRDHEERLSALEHEVSTLREKGP